MIWCVIGIVLLFLLLAGALPIAFAIGSASLTSLYPVLGTRVLPLIGRISWEIGANFALAAAPLFVLMGELISLCGLADRAYTGLSKAFQGLKGGLVQTNILACTVFAACSGSSVASAATMGRIAYSDLVLKRGYEKNLVLGSLAGGGTLGILIPPSIIFIIYAVIAEESVGKLFIAGIFPGLILSAMFLTYVAIRTTLQPHLVPREMAERVRLLHRIRGFFDTWPLLVLILIVLGCIYGGIATATEAAAMGATGAMILGALYRRLNWKVLSTACLNTSRTMAMIFLILIAAKMLTMMLAYYRVTILLAGWGGDTFTAPLALFAALVIFYLILGMFFDGLSMMVMTLPFVLPLVAAAGFDPIWFGVVLVILIEISLLTPPVGLNLFVLQSVSGAPLTAVVKGSLPYVAMQLLGIALLYAYPHIALWLPNMMITR